MGHKSSECGGKGGNGKGGSGSCNNVGAEEGEVAEVGGVWTIAAVEDEKNERKSKNRVGLELMKVGRNRFEVLRLDSDEEEDEKLPELRLDICAVAPTEWNELDIAQIKTEIIVDSAAEESVCPLKWADDFGTQQSAKTLKLVNASGGKI